MAATDDDVYGGTLDAKVERLVFGGDIIDTRVIPSYSWQMNDAWKVVRYLSDRFPSVLIDHLPSGDVLVTFRSGVAEDEVAATGRFAPEAICRAALKAVAAEDRLRAEAEGRGGTPAPTPPPLGGARRRRER